MEAWDAHSSSPAATASTTMPLEKTSRSPRVCSCRGAYRSCARIEPSTGNPLNAVFAASTSTSAVNAVIQKKPTERSPPKTAAATWAMTVLVLPSGGRPRSAGFSATRTSLVSASAVMPANMVIASTPRTSSVRAAFALFGGLNAGTPLAIASTPVSAVQPEEKARSARKTSATPA